MLNFQKELVLGSSDWDIDPFDFNASFKNLIITQTAIEPYRHKYLKNTYTHDDMEQFTYGDLSQYA